MAEPVRVGSIHYIKPGGKKSSKKYAALHARTQKPPRLEIFDNKESFEKNGKKQIVNLENCSPLEADSNSCAIRITVESKTLTITLDNYEEYSAWLSDLNFTLFGYSSGSEYYSVLDDAQLYDVVIHETDVARRLHLKGSYYLYVSLEEVELLNKQTKKSVIKWPLYQLRKYGRDKQEFSLEAGRRCQSGEGMFYFKTDQYNAIFQEVEHNVKALASRGRAASTSSTNSHTFNHQKPHFAVQPSSPRAQHPGSSLYDDPIDVRRDKGNKSPAADDAYTYNEPVKAEKPPVKSKPPKPKIGKKKPKELAPAREGPKKPPRKLDPTPPMVSEATYAEASPVPSAPTSLSDEYSHLNLGPMVNDAEYDSISYKDPGKKNNGDSTYATASNFPGSFPGQNAQQDTLYDHVKR